MLSCPHCHQKLLSRPMAGGATWACKSCEGQAVSGGLLRSLMPQKLALQLAASVRPARPGESMPSCPSCRREMGRSDAASSALGFEVEQCASCDLWWFDQHEVERTTAPVADTPLGAPTPQPSASTNWQRQRVQRHAEKAQRRLERHTSRAPSMRAREIELRLPSSGLKILLTLIGMPAEEDAPILRTKPLTTWFLSAVTAAVSFSALYLDPRLIDALALLPSDGGGSFGLQYLSYFFVHGSLFHLVTNLYFLVVFGDNVEELLGPARYILVLMIATVVSGFTHVLLDPQSEIPLVGASGGISAIVVYYGLALPKVRLSIFLLLFWVRIAAIWALILWLVMQVTGIFDQINGMSDISFAGHLGGAAVGFVAWLMMRPSTAQSAEAGLKRPRY